jgi:hypothetical protein
VTSRPHDAVEVKTARSYAVRMGCLHSALAVGLLGPCVAMVRRSSHFGMNDAILLAMGAALVLAPIVLLVHDRRRWIRRFDGSGVELRSGKRHSWRDFVGAREVRWRSTRGNSWYFAISFRGGSGRVYPTGVENVAEVLQTVRALCDRSSPYLRDRRG